MVKGTDFRFDMHIPRVSLDMTPCNIFKNGAWAVTRPLKFTWQINALSERILVFYVVLTLYWFNTVSLEKDRTSVL